MSRSGPHPVETCPCEICTTVRNAPGRVPPGPTLEEYFRDGFSRDVIDYELRAQRDASGRVYFYIHPARRDGVTFDFVVEGNELHPPFPGTPLTASPRT